jgi:hypothetical protein
LKSLTFEGGGGSQVLAAPCTSLLAFRVRDTLTARAQVDNDAAFQFFKLFVFFM